MYETIIFSVAGNQERAKDGMSKLKEILSGFGVAVRLEKETANDGEPALHLIFNFDSDRVKRIKTRGAGRKEVYTAANPATCAEVAEMRKTMSEADVLDRLGISRSTYYRRLKRLNGIYPDDLYF